MNANFGRFIILLGFVLVAVGTMLMLKIHIPWIGRLPGDIYIKKENFSFYFPITTSVLLSVLLSLLFHLFRK